MASYKKKDIKRSLLKKGFELVEKRDHLVLRLMYNGKKTDIYTKISHGSGTIDDPKLINNMQKQVRLDKESFDLLIKCPLTKQKYFEILSNNDLL